jgi:hypothetical protein
MTGIFSVDLRDLGLGCLGARLFREVIGRRLKCALDDGDADGLAAKGPLKFAPD